MITGMKNIVIFVRDFERAKRFYQEQLRLPLVQESMAMMEFFPGGGTTLGVATALHEDALKLVGRHTGVTLTARGIEQLCRDLTAAGVAFAEPLEVSPWGKMAVVKDPDGNQLALVELS
jgi:lactoylglutathione lyase